MSSLALQLSQNASLNASLLSTSRRKPIESYLFPPSQASAHDLESIHSLAVNAFLQLISVQPACRKYEAALFSDSIKELDRTLLNNEKADELNTNISGFMRLLGPWVMEGMVGKILEWLVRRFRVNEFNIEDVISLFLPYHESPHFSKMLSILHIPPQSTFSFLLPFKSAASHVPRTALVTSMLASAPLARFVALLLSNAHQGRYVHRTLVAFNIGVMHAYIVRAKILEEGVVGFVLSALVDVLKGPASNADANVILGSYVLLSTLSQKTTLSSNAVKAIIGAMSNAAARVATGHFLKAAVAVCEPQDQVDEWDETVVDKLLRLSNFERQITATLEWLGSEKFVVPLLSGLISRIAETIAMSTLQTLTTAPSTPSAVLTSLGSFLLLSVISSQEVDTAPHRTLLCTIQQRHPGVLRAASEVVVEGDEGTKEAVEQVIISLSVVFSGKPTASESADFVVASTIADENVRVIAVKELLNAVSSAEPNDMDSIKSALLARVHDTSSSVIEALYSQPAVILPLLTASPTLKVYLGAVSTVLANDPPRTLIRAHLTFLASHFSILNGLLGIFETCFLPFLLFSKSRKETARMVWEIIERNGEGVGQYELARGCADAWKWQMDKSEEGNVMDWMPDSNMVIAARMAENILTSAECDQHLAGLVERMQSENPHTRTLAYLASRALVGGLMGDRQIVAAQKMLDAMKLETLEGMEDIPSGRDGQLSVDDKSLGLKIVLKPASRKTLYYLKTAVLALLPQIPRPAVLDWYSLPVSEKHQESLYISLMRTIYKLANSSTSVPLLSTNIIRTLFLSLKEDALVFLSGTLVRSLEEDVDQRMCVAALRHATAFITAQPNIDFQTVLPSFIMAVASADAEIRQASLDCIAIMSANHNKPTAIYGFDTIYGETSKTLQYLDAPDLTNYLQSIVDSSSLLTKDRNYTKVFHQRALSKNKSDSKAQIKHKQNVLSYLLSHIDSIRSPNAQIILLTTIHDISDETKVLVLGLKAQESTSSDVIARYGSSLEEYTYLVVSAFDNSAVGALNRDGSAIWPVFLSVVQYYFRSDALPRTRSVLMRNIEHNLFTNLSLERQVELCTVLLRAGAHHPSAVQSKQLLKNSIKTVPLIQILLSQLQPPAAQVSPAKKKAKLDNDVSSDDPFVLLTIFVEILAASELPGSLDLISHLLDTLNNVLHYETPTHGDKSFVEQLLMSAIDHSAAKVVEKPNLSPSAVRLDILVELIRVSDNTQTFHQALLLMASLARLTPESVLHNVMPIFTFMGSNVFQRDDSYSFRVVQQTVNSIVPVMVSSLKTEHANKMDLFIGSRDFLRIFTDAAHYIPRHRRTNFFLHLVDVLGPDDFLAPICMLLIDKVVNRVHRQNAEEISTSFALPVSILQHYAALVQVSGLLEILKESRRLVSHAAGSDTTQRLFMPPIRDEESIQSLSTPSKRRAQALIVFVGHALQTSSSKLSGDSAVGKGVGDIVSLLVQLVTFQSGSASDSNIETVVQAAQSTMSVSLGVMPAAEFMNVVLALLETGNTNIQIGALDMLTTRLEMVSPNMRRSTTGIVVNIVDRIRTFVLGNDGSLAISAFAALRSIGLTICPGEEIALSNTIPSILAAMRGRRVAQMAMSALLPLISGLGPRLIPNFRHIIDECASVVLENLQDNTRSSTLVTDALSVLKGLLVSIPTFWGSAEFMLVLKIHIDNSTAKNPSSTITASLMKSLMKRGPSKVLVPTLCQFWNSRDSSLRTNGDRLVAYFNLLKLCLRNASRPVVLENIRQLFQVFLEGFDAPASLPQTDTKAVEAQLIPAFQELVVKLNEAAFRPLFRRLYDWGFADDNGSNLRKITFCHLYASLLDYFKGLMSTYMSFLLQSFIEILRDFAMSSSIDRAFWSSIIETLTKSFISDEGVFWRDERLQQIAPTLVEQVAGCARLSLPDGKAALAHCLEVMTELITDDALLKSTNLGLLMHTRSEDARLRIFALSCCEVIWRSHGGKLLGFVTETVTFIAECVEDDNDLVVKEAYRLKHALENVAGNINV